MSEVEYEVPTSDSDLGQAPELDTELLVLPEWPLKNRKAAAFVMTELDTGEHDEFENWDKKFDEVGNLIGFKRAGRVYEYLARTTLGTDGHRIWANAEAAEKRLRPIGKKITNKMVAAADRVNYGGAKSADDAAQDAEGKSEETSSDS